MNAAEKLDRVNSLWLDCHLATMAPREPLGEPYGIISDAALAVSDGIIVWLGRRSDLPDEIEKRAKAVHRLGGQWVTPGFIDCHTHLVYAGSRSREFEMRLQGTAYAEIARSGGGIMSTVRAVRAAGEDDLFDQSVLRLRAMQAQGVTTVEIKSGYGLDTANELKMLRVARRLGREFPVTVSPTFLGAHALPPEYGGRPDAYVDLVVNEMLPAVASQDLAVAVDVFCETIGFTVSQTEKVFAAAAEYGLGVKLHAEQLSDQKGAVMASAYNSMSVDHLEYLGYDGVAALTGTATVAVLLPGAFYFLGETQKPPVDLLRKAGVPLAVSTDCNPGSSPCTSPLLMMNMACVLFGLTPAEALAGVTINAARALGLESEVGSLAFGKKADLAAWNIDGPAELAYRLGDNPCRLVVKAGEVLGHNIQR